MKIANVEKALNEVRPFLFQFMKEEGFFQSEDPKNRDYFLCPFPSHKDTHPSAHLLASGVKGFCHSCSRTFDLLTLNHIKTGAPISGIGFITNNLVNLCNRFGVPFVMGDLSEEDRFKIDSYHACKIASDYITSQEWPERLAKYLESRGLTVAEASALGIGVIPNYEAFERMMKEHYTTVFLRETSFLRQGVFGPSNIIFTIKDPNGTPVGFISRDLAYEERYQAWAVKGRVGAPPRKYDSTGESNRIYFKRDLLFGLSSFLETEDTNRPLYIFEGQFDWALAVARGFTNCVALSGKAFTPSHLSLLRKHKISDLVLVLDGDQPGKDALRKLLLGDKDNEGMLACSSFFKVFVVELPEGEDPNSYILKNGIEAFKAIPMADSFSWALSNQDIEQDPIKTCEIMIPFIMAEANILKREFLIAVLSDATGSSVKAITEEIERREDLASVKVRQEKRIIAEEALRDLNFGEMDSTLVLESALEKVREIEVLAIADPLSLGETLIALDEQKREEQELDGPAGYSFSKLKNLEVALNGDCTGTVIAIGGSPNTGKCQRYDTLVLQADGTFKTIEDLYLAKTGSAVTMSRDHRLVRSEISDYIDSGLQPTLDLVLDSGMVTHPTLNHPYYTLGGWKKASDLRVGDAIAVSRKYQCFDDLESPLSADELVVIAALLAEGGLSGKAVRFTNTDIELIEMFKAACLRLWPGVTFTQEGITYSVVDPTERGNRARDFCESHHLMGTLSKTKPMPDDVFKCSKKDLAIFLGVFWSGDGWVDSSREEGFEIGLSLANEKLLMSIRHLLLRFGIYTTISHSTSSYTGSDERFDRWTISIGDIANAKVFHREIPLFIDYKRDHLEEIVNRDRSEKRSSYKQSFPGEVWPHILKCCANLGYSRTKLCGEAFGYKTVVRDGTTRLRSVPVYRHSRDESVSQSSLAKFAKVLGDDFLLSLVEGDVVFDKIVEIKDGGVHQCYDLTVPDTHNFVTNDIIVHNSSLMSQLAVELPSCNESLVVSLFTIDDNRTQMTRRFVVQIAVEEAFKAGSPLADSLTINKIANPRYWIERYPEEHRDLMHFRELGYQKVRKLIQDGRLHVKDMTHGTTIGFLERMVKRIREDFPKDEVVCILDNFHKAQDFSGADERTATKRKSQYLKTNIAQRYGIGVFSTFEYKKIESGKRPTNNDLREAVNIEYDINYLEHLYSPLKAAFDAGSPEKCFLYHGDSAKPLPIVEGDIGKNKITEVVSERHYYKFYPAQSRYESISAEEANAIRDMNKMDMARDEGRAVLWEGGKKIVVVPNKTYELTNNVEFQF